MITQFRFVLKTILILFFFLFRSSSIVTPLGPFFIRLFDALHIQFLDHTRRFGRLNVYNLLYKLNKEIEYL